MTDTSPLRPPLNQIALSVIDLRRTERWFREGLGFLPAGGSRLMMSGPLAARVQGLPGAASTCWWLVGRNSWFQLELFQFRRPVAKLMRDDAWACDIGYRRIGVWVADFDAALSRLAALGTQPLTAPIGEAGDRRVCVHNPDGVFVEIMEKDPLPQPAGSEREPCGVAVRSVTLSTSDLGATAAYLEAVSGGTPTSRTLHAPEREALWGLEGAETQSVVFECGDVLVEAVQYFEPAGRPWPAGYRVCDQGILNIAFGARTRHEHTAIFERVRAFGATPNFRPLHLPGAGVVYVNDALGFSIEILWMARWNDKHWGFVPMAAHRRPVPDNQRVHASVEVAASPAAVWNVLNDQDRMGTWIGFDHVSVQREGFASRDGRGSERLMKGLPGTVVEQVTGAEPDSFIRYRVIEGSPFAFHQGEIQLTPSAHGTTVDWSIRFRSKLPLLGWLWRAALQRMLTGMLRKGLKVRVEASA
jgi:uncharacterized protein YndB with AHSA1/START domain/catechol 2,3-dioxygenase-like lactoylglutathione lyase family enzyme